MKRLLGTLLVVAVVLVAAVLLGRSAMHSIHTDIGFDVDRVLAERVGYSPPIRMSRSASCAGSPLSLSLK